MGFDRAGDPVSIGSDARAGCDEDASPSEVARVVMAEVGGALFAYVAAHQAGQDISDADALWAVTELTALKDEGWV